MRIDDIYPSKYLKADDIPPGQTITVTVRAIIMEDVGDKEIKPVLYFMNKEKGAVMNKTNGYLLAMGLGDETDTWPGKQIQIYTEMKSFNGKLVPGLSMRVPQIQAQPAAQPAPLAPAAQTVADLSQDIKAAESDAQAVQGDNMDDLPF